jgi:hypothetical protein
MAHNDLDFLLEGTTTAAPSHTDVEQPRPTQVIIEELQDDPMILLREPLVAAAPTRSVVAAPPSTTTSLGLPSDVQSASSGAPCGPNTSRAGCCTAGTYTSTTGSSSRPCTSTQDGYPVANWHSSPGSALRLLRHPLHHLIGTGELLECLGQPSVEGCYG